MTLLSEIEMHKRGDVVLAHGILMSAAFALLFPLGAAIVNMFKNSRYEKAAVRVHYVCQTLGLLAAYAGLGLMGWFLNLPGKSMLWTKKNCHPIIGIVVLSALTVQPILGLVHHLRTKKTKQPTYWGYTHRYWGRVFALLGVINGGLGLQLASLSGERAIIILVYSFVAGVSYFVWLQCGLISAIIKWKFDQDQSTRGAESRLRRADREHAVLQRSGEATDAMREQLSNTSAMDMHPAFREQSSLVADDDALRYESCATGQSVESAGTAATKDTGRGLLRNDDIGKAL